MDGSGKPRRLGRGLSALMSAAPVRVQIPEGDATHGDIANDQRAKGGEDAQGQVATGQRAKEDAEADAGGVDVGRGAAVFLMVPLRVLSASPYQPRRSIGTEELAELASSIRRSGVMQPVIVRPMGDGYELVAGERRWRAAELVGLETIPAIVRELDDETVAEWALVENVQRVDLNAIEKARALGAMMSKFGHTQSELAERVGLERSTVANLLRVLELEDRIQLWIEEGKLSTGHAKVLLSAAPGKRFAAAKRCVEELWTIRQLDAHLNASSARRGEKPERPAELADLETRLGKHLATKVKIATRDGKRGKVVIEFYGLDHFDDVMGRLGFGE